jgi:DNA repair protein RadC
METTCIREVSAKYSKPRKPAHPIKTAAGIAAFIRPIVEPTGQEHFIILTLDGANQITSYSIVTKGLVNSSQCHPREVFRAAILNNAVSIICAHNHPSGDTTPSQEDKLITKKLEIAGDTLSIHLLDHVIVGFNSYFSFKEAGLI